MSLMHSGSLSQIAVIPRREHIGKAGGVRSSMVASLALPPVMIR